MAGNMQVVCPTSSIRPKIVRSHVVVVRSRGEAISLKDLLFVQSLCALDCKSHIVEAASRLELLVVFREIVSPSPGISLPK